MKEPLRLEWRDPEELRENPQNWRRHPRAQVGALREALAEVGWAGAALYNERTGHLIDGHLRKKVAKKNEKIPVLVGSWSEEHEAKILLTLDPLAGMAQADVDRLTELLDAVHSEDSPAVGELLARIADQWLPVNSTDEILDPEAPIERAAELQTKWRTARGQLWKIGAHLLLCGDCRDGDAVARLWCGSGPSIRMIWTDPPYGIDYVQIKNDALRHLHKGTRVKTGIANDSLTPEKTHELFRAALTLAAQRAHKGAVCYATVAAGPLLVGFIQAFEAAGFSFKHHLIWVKQQMVLGRSDYHYRHEPIIYGWLENGPHYFTTDRTQDTVFEFDKPATSQFHPTTKPTALIARMIANSSRPRELVYDPFCGSGSTLLAAHQLGRIGYGVEIDPGYVAVTLERLSALGLKPELVK
jgi:DNA modification methylase